MLIQKIDNQALLHLLYVLTSLNRSFKVKGSRLINAFEPVPSVSTIDFQSPALLKIPSIKTTCPSIHAGTARHTGENRQLSKKDFGFRSKSKLSPGEAKKPTGDDIKWQTDWAEFKMYIPGWSKKQEQSSRPKLFCKKGVFKNFAKFTRIHLCQNLFFNKVVGQACNFI